MARWSIEAEAAAFEAKGIANGEQGFGDPPECIGCSVACDNCPEADEEDGVMADDMRRNLADMLKAKGADDEGVAKMLGLVDDHVERVRAEDRARDDALGLLVYKALHDHPGYDEEWLELDDDERAPYIGAAKAVEQRVEAECDEIVEELQNELEAERVGREQAEDALDEIERVIAKARGGSDAAS